MNIWKKKGYMWVTLGLFVISFGLHWLFGWEVYQSEQLDLGKIPQLGGYLNQMIRDTMENWQSEFLQLIWQVAGLAFLLHVGSPQSKDGDERKEEKLDHIIRKVDFQGDKFIEELDEKYPKK